MTDTVPVHDLAADRPPDRLEPDELAYLRALMAGTYGAPAPLATVIGEPGWVPSVSSGTVVESVWGNAVRDRLAHRFASVADRDTQWPAAPAGARAFTVDTQTEWLRTGTPVAWVPVSAASRMLAWSPIDNPVSGGIGTAPHTAVQLSVATPAGAVIEARAQLPIAWASGQSPAAGDLIGVDLQVDGSSVAAGDCFTCPFTAGTAVMQKHHAFIHQPTAATHTYAWKIYRVTGAAQIALGTVGFAALYHHGGTGLAPQ